MLTSRATVILAAVLMAFAVWLMLPRGYLRGRMAGVVLGAVALGMFGSQIAWMQSRLANSMFVIQAAVTVGSAIAAITFRSPVYCAIWFGLMLMGMAGLFMLQGAQFLAVATVVVYAGAILVTFLFVLMLAQPTGRARYDRVSWEALLSSFCGAFVTGLLTLMVFIVFRSPDFKPPAIATAEQRRQEVLSPENVAKIGGQLFGRYLVAVEVGGVLLLAALVGEAVIVGQTRGPLAGPRRGTVEPDASIPARDGGDVHA